MQGKVQTLLAFSHLQAAALTRQLAGVGLILYQWKPMTTYPLVSESRPSVVASVPDHHHICSSRRGTNPPPPNLPNHASGRPPVPPQRWTVKDDFGDPHDKHAQESRQKGTAQVEAPPHHHKLLDPLIGRLPCYRHITRVDERHSFPKLLRSSIHSSMRRSWVHAAALI